MRRLARTDREISMLEVPETTQRFISETSERSGVEPESVERVLRTLGIERVVEKLTALSALFDDDSRLNVGPLAESARAIAGAVKPEALRVENLHLEYFFDGVMHGDGLSAMVAD